MLFKFFWVLRAIFYKAFFGSFRFPSYIGKPIFLKNIKRIFIAKRVRIFPGSRMEVVSSSASIVIETNVSIGQNFHIISGRKLIIGRDTTISANVLMTNVDHEFREIDKHILDQPLMIEDTKIGENCFIGYGVVIQAGTILGKQCIVGANAVVRGIFPDCCVIVGAPARIVKRYDEESAIWRKTKSDGEFIDEK